MHTVTSLAAVLLTCNDLSSSVRFYRALGLDLKETRHGGPVHFACALSGVHFALYPDDGTEQTLQGRNQLGFMVSNLDSVLSSLKTVGARVISPPQPKPWGITAVVLDPDGRKLELVANHVEVSGPMPF